MQSVLTIYRGAACAPALDAPGLQLNVYGRERGNADRARQTAKKSSARCSGFGLSLDIVEKGAHSLDTSQHYINTCHSFIVKFEEIAKSGGWTKKEDSGVTETMTMDRPN